MSEKCYMLLDQDMTSYGGCAWTLGEWKESDEPGVFHGYEHPLLAVLHSPIHTEILDPRLFEAEADGAIVHEGMMRLTAQRMRIVREIAVPAVRLEQRIAYAIYCAKAVCSNPEWNRWADEWLSGNRRSGQAAADAVLDLALRLAEEEWAAGHVATALVAACAASTAERHGHRCDSDRWAVEVAEKAAFAALAATQARGVDLISCAEKAMGVVES